MPIENKVLLQLSENDPSLTYLDLSYCSLTVSDIERLVKSLESNTHLAALDVSGNPIGDGGAELLASPNLNLTTLLAAECNISAVKAFANNAVIQRLDLASNNIGAAGATLLAESKALNSLSLAGNHIGDIGAIALARNSSLVSLTLSHNKISSRGANALAKNTTLKVLILNYNMIQADGAIALAHNNYLVSLAIAGNNIETPGIIALSQNTHLTSMDISYNEVNDHGLIAFAKNSNLTELNLGYNQVTHIGAHDLENTKLKSLNLCHNLLKNEGATALARNKTINCLNIAGNNISFEGAYAFAKNEKLTSLTLSSNMIGDVGGVVLAQNNILIELFLSYNGIGDASARAFADNITLKILNLNYNKISEKGRRILTEKMSPARLMLSQEQPPDFTEENLDTIFLLSESFLCISNINSTLQFFNPAFSRVLGYSDDEILTKPTLDFLHPQDKEKLQKEFSDDKMMPVRSYENRYRCKDNTFRTIRWSSHIKHNRQYAVGTDVTEIRRIEKEAILAHRENAVELLQEAQDYNLRQTEFIAHLSHEIRNPLSGIYGLLDTLKLQIKHVEMLIDELHHITSPLLQEGLIASFAGIHESLNDMITCAEYQKAILNDNLDIVKISEKKFVLEQKPFEINESLMQVITMLKAKATQKKLAVNFIEPEEKEIWVKGDPSRLKQIAMNLLGNAIKFTEMGKIDISLRTIKKTSEHTLVEIDVIDTGIGLNTEDLSHLFQRFSQASQTIGSQYGGSGLGFYLAKQLANAMGGDITAKSEQGKNTTFTMTLQFNTLSLEEKKLGKEKKEDSKIWESSSPLHSLSIFNVPEQLFVKCTVLIVDDNIINQKILSRMLDSVGYSYQIANNGLEALLAFDKSSFDVILMDILMPKMDGITTTKEIRKREQERNLSKTPIFAITANALERDQNEGLSAGIDFYFTKPFIRNAILEKISSLKSNEKPVKTLSPAKADKLSAPLS